MATLAKSAGRGAYAGPGCPKCGCFLPEAAPPAGRHECWRCSLKFEMASFDPPERAAPAAAHAFDGAAGAPCARHERNAAVATCDRCGAFMCSLCRIDSDGKALCAACFARLDTAGELADTRVKYRHYNGMALQMSLFGALFWVISPLMGPLAVFTALRGLKQSKRLGETLGVGGARFAIGLGALEAVGGTFLVLSMFGVFK